MEGTRWYEEAIWWNISRTQILGDLVTSFQTSNTLNGKQVSSNVVNVGIFNNFCWYSRAYDGLNYVSTSNLCFSTQETCENYIKDNDETDIDYGGNRCGQCQNRTFMSDDAPYLVLKEGNLLSLPFNSSQCDEGNAVIGSIEIIILLVIIGLVILGGIVAIFGLIPLIIFVITGNFKILWWGLLFRKTPKKKKENDENEHI